MSQDNQTSIPDAPQASRRALLMGFAAAATPMAPALANALSESAPAAADPIFAAIEAHGAALEQYDAAHEHFEAMDTLYPREWIDWSVEQRLAWRDAEMARREGGPRDIAYDRWNDQCDAVNVATEALVEASPATIAGAAAVLEYWMEFSARFDESGEFDFLELDCTSRLMSGVVALLRGQA
jgi:hypothetical protein